MNRNTANSFPSQYDDISSGDYDPAYTVDIGQKMRVPDSIGAISGDNRKSSSMSVFNGSAKEPMKVPDKIVIMGDDQHVGMKEEPQLHSSLDVSPSTHMPVGLSTPPSTLTLTEPQFPLAYTESTGDIKNSAKNSLNLSLNTERAMVSSNNQTGSLDGIREEDVRALRLQLQRMTCAVAALQEENQRRSQRELLLYPTVISYMIFKFVQWFFRH